VSRESFRRDLNRAFDEITGSPSSSLPDRVRFALDQAPAETPPLWLAGVAAALIVAVLVGLLVIGPLRNHQPILGGPGPSPTPAPSAQPSPSPAYDCGTAFRITSSSAPAVANIDDVRVGTHPGYDRITIEFANGQPATVELTPQNNATFIHDGRGDSETIGGSYGLRVVIRGADEHTSYSGPTDFKADFPALIEAKNFGDYEGVVTWGLGLSTPACYRAYILTDPTRLVIDIQVQ